MHVVCLHCQTTNRLPPERLGERPDCGRCGRPLFEARPASLDTAAFDRQRERSEIPLLVDFWAPWCGPCRTMAPAFEQAAEQLEPQFRLVKINTDEEQELGVRYQIRSIPTLILLRNGREVARQAGAMAAGEIVRWARSN